MQLNYQWSLLCLTLAIIAVTFIFIYWLLNTNQREWVKYYLIPILFFLGLAVKTLLRGIKLFIKMKTKNYVRVLFSVNNLLVISFMVLTTISYIIRSRPVHKAKGIKERGFPLFVLSSQFISIYLIARYTKFYFNPFIYISGVVLSILGSIIGCLALWKLKKSFSIMVEIRDLITKGIYGRVRHPLYAGELVSLLGIAMLFNNIAGYGMFLFLLVMQSIRAILEERKLTAHFPEYATYKENTGFFFPRLRLKRDKVTDNMPY